MSTMTVDCESDAVEVEVGDLHYLISISFEIEARHPKTHLDFCADIAALATPPPTPPPRKNATSTKITVVIKLKTLREWTLG